MAEKKQQQQKSRARKGVKKKFYAVEAPLVSTPVELYLVALEDAGGRTVSLDLSRSLRGRSGVLVFRVLVEGEKLRAVPLRFTLAGSHVRKVMRRGADYIEDSFVVSGKSGDVLLKPFLLARRKVSRSVCGALREEAKKILEGWVKVRDAEELFSDIMAGKIQKELSQKLRKVYPLAVAEVRWIEMVGGEEKDSEKKE